MEIRRSYDRLISTMGFPILVRWHLPAAVVKARRKWMWLNLGPQKTIAESAILLPYVLDRYEDITSGYTGTMQWRLNILRDIQRSPWNVDVWSIFVCLWSQAFIYPCTSVMFVILLRVFVFHAVHLPIYVNLDWWLNWLLSLSIRCLTL